MKIKMNIYEKIDGKLGRTFHRILDEDDIERLVRHILIEEGYKGIYDIDIDEIITQ